MNTGLARHVAQPRTHKRALSVVCALYCVATCLQMLLFPDDYSALCVVLHAASPLDVSDRTHRQGNGASTLSTSRRCGAPGKTDITPSDTALHRGRIG